MSSKTKNKSRKLVIHKERSRNAARVRRSKESVIFDELSKLVPNSDFADESSQLDKTTLIRLASCYLRLRTLINSAQLRELFNKHCFKVKNCDKLKNADVLNSYSYLRALQGFVAIIIAECRTIVYISPNVSKIIGLKQDVLLNNSVYEYLHPCDHPDLDDVCNQRRSSTGSTLSGDPVHLWRFKCTLASHGRNLNVKSANYKTMQCTAHLIYTKDEPGTDPSLLFLIAEPIPHPFSVNIPIYYWTFLTRHSLDMKITDCDDGIEQVLGFDKTDIIGKSIFLFHHALDSAGILKAYKNLYSKQQMKTGIYRFLAKNGGYAWIETQASVLVSKSKSNKSVTHGDSTSIVCIHSVISEVKEPDCIFTDFQMMPSLINESKPEIKHDKKSHDQKRPNKRLSQNKKRPSDKKPKKTPLMPIEVVFNNNYTSITDEQSEQVDSSNDYNSYSNCQKSSVCVPTSCFEHNLISSSENDSLSLRKNVYMASHNSQLTSKPTPPNEKTLPVECTKSTVEGLTELNDLTTDVSDSLWEMRAPYIPLLAEEDYNLSVSPVPLFDEEIEGGNMLGATESVIFLATPETSTEEDINDQRDVPIYDFNIHNDIMIDRKLPKNIQKTAANMKLNLMPYSNTELLKQQVVAPLNRSNHKESFSHSSQITYTNSDKTYKIATDESAALETDQFVPFGSGELFTDEESVPLDTHSQQLLFMDALDTVSSPPLKKPCLSNSTKACLDVPTKSSALSLKKQLAMNKSKGSPILKQLLEVNEHLDIKTAPNSIYNSSSNVFKNSNKNEKESDSFFNIPDSSCSQSNYIPNESDLVCVRLPKNRSSEMSGLDDDNYETHCMYSSLIEEAYKLLQDKNLI